MPGSALVAVPTAQIHAELRRRQGLAASLAAMRDRLRAKVVRVEAEIAGLGGTLNGTGPHRDGRRAPGRPARRGQRRSGTPLREVLARALKGKIMTATEAVAAARAAGYRTTSKSFYHAVAAVLAQSGRFRRVGRGRYSTTGGTPNGAVSGRPGAPRRRRAGGPGSRGPRPGSVVSILGDTLKGKTMTVTEAVAAVRADGYKTKATPKSFYGAVAFALAQSGRFRRVARGKYAAR